MSVLQEKRCIPCAEGTPPLQGEEIARLIAELRGNWTVAADGQLLTEFRFRNFSDGMAFAVRVGELAEREGHHPEMCIGFRRVRIALWTHKSNGLTESDFIFAAKVNLIRSA